MSEINQIDFSKVQPINKIAGEDENETELLRKYFLEAADYVNAQKWCSKVVESFYGFGVGGVVAVFLFNICSEDTEVDDYVWVIVGDIPSLYLTVENCPNPACALDGYIGALEQWAEAAIEQKTMEGLPPVSAPATVKNGKDLKRRLEFLDREVLSLYQADLV